MAGVQVTSNPVTFQFVVKFRRYLLSQDNNHMNDLICWMAGVQVTSNHPVKIHVAVIVYRYCDSNNHHYHM